LLRNEAGTGHSPVSSFEAWGESEKGVDSDIEWEIEKRFGGSVNS
jgi:hypothetical protein